MTEKRFELYDVGNGYFTYCGIEDNNEGDCFENMEQCRDKMNALHEENEQLKSDKQALIDFIKMKFPKSWKHILEGFE